MRKGRRRKPSLDVSLFPFLAVLVSTMGALILLLLVFNQQASKQTLQKALEALAVRFDPIKMKLASDLERSSQALKEAIARQRRTEGLAAASRGEKDAENQSGALLKKRLGESRASLAELVRRANQLVDEKQKLARENEKLKQQRALLVQQALEAGGIEPVLSSGTLRTRKIPMFIECQSDQVVIRPEEIEFEADEVVTPPGRPNPFAILVSGLVDHEQRQKPQPVYPLLLVRPDGINAFYAVRAVLDELGLQYGYELIDSDWTLRYPDPDPGRIRLAEQLRSRIRDGLVLGPGSGAGGAGTGSGGRRHEGRGQSKSGARVPSGGGLARRTIPNPELPLSSNNISLEQLAGIAPLVPRRASDTPRTDNGELGPGLAGTQSPSPTKDHDELVLPQQPGASTPVDSHRDATSIPNQEGRIGGQIGDAQRTTRGQLSQYPNGPGEPGANSGQPGQMIDPRLRITRNVEVILDSNRLLIGDRSIELADEGAGDVPMQRTTREIHAAVAAVVSKWRRPGSTFRWRPNLQFRLPLDMLPQYYQVRHQLLDSGFTMEHQIVLDRADTEIPMTSWRTMFDPALGR